MVIGGLEGFVRNLRARTRDPRILGAADHLDGYRELHEGARRQRLAEAIALVGGETAARGARAAAPAAEPPHRPSATPPPAVAAPPRPPRLHLARPSAPAGETLVQAQPPPPGMDLETPIASLKGIGPKRAKHFARLGLLTVRDLLFHFPSRHQPYPPVVPIADLLFQAEGSVVGVLERMEAEDLNRGLKRLRATIRDNTGTAFAVWLRHGYANLGVQPGEPIAVSGKLVQAGRQLTFDNPDFERGDAPPLHTRTLVPVYPLTSGLFDKELRRWVHWSVAHFADAIEDPLPASMRVRQGLPTLPDALRALHFPTTREAYERARRRFAFDELLDVQFLVLQRRRAWQAGGAPVLDRRPDAIAAIESAFPFSLTDAQKRVIDEILADLGQPRPMTRLVQGEVGSGKTAVAAVALCNTLASGHQGALMAPTEILAEQHFASVSRFFEAAANALETTVGRRPSVRLLTGSVKGKARQAIYEAARDGSVDVLVGTQALIQETLEFARLGLVVVDEQHRFGVKQRVTLRHKAGEVEGTPHLLVMTATPIPRTLALTLYGDLDRSLLDELPPGRQEIKTVLLGPGDRGMAYEKVRREAAKGRQAFLICPLVEESDVLEARAATDEYERLRQGELSSLRLGLLHGRMKPAEKDHVMRQFRDHELDVLVSTAVVEVGVDIPNATVMLIEGAERFGLAQLHQFRGRVGRGEYPSVCILLTDQENPHENERLRVIAASSNGLELAEQDLRLRGPGDYFGVRQSGFPELKAARLDDALLIEAARAEASTLLDTDPELALPEHAALRQHVDAFHARMGEPS